MPKLIIGLGNPGNKYQTTRHNIGFMVLDYLQKQFAENFTEFKQQKKFNAQFCEGKLENTKIFLAKPETFMNESGQTARLISQFYKIKTEDIIVVQDDSDLFVGELKLVFDRSSAGHKGIDSIIRSLGSKQFTRLRVGIRPKARIRRKAETFVLKPFGVREKIMLKKQLQTIEQIIISLLTTDLEKTKSLFGV